MSYHHLPPPGAFDHRPFVEVLAIGFPRDWVREYEENEYFRIDPIPHAALNVSYPFWWSEVTAKAKSCSAGVESYLRRLRTAGLGDGLAVPVFGPHGRNGYVGLGTGGPRPPMDDEQTLTLQAASQAAHLRYCELVRARQPTESLSEREREILRWIARGKSNGVIAEILDLSPNTVDTYVRRLFRKLRVAERVTAALRGLALGLID